MEKKIYFTVAGLPLILFVIEFSSLGVEGPRQPYQRSGRAEGVWI